MRKDIEFSATDGTILRGWHYLPDGRPGKHPTIIMAHGFSAVKEMYLDRYAEVFAHAGFASVIYDNRNFGASDGLPRQEIDPWLQIRDYSDAITFAQSLGETDAEHIGVWGSSYSGGHVLVVGAIDRRVKCVVSQVPAVSGSQGFRRLVRADFIAGLHAQLAEDRLNRAAGKPPAMIPVIDENPAAVSALPTADSYKWFSEMHKSLAPSWRNEVTLRTLGIRLRLRARGLYRQYQPDALVANRRRQGSSSRVGSGHQGLRAGLRAEEARAAAWGAFRCLCGTVRSIMSTGVRVVRHSPHG
jgi:pimeloyl-ACP methyl ester carboxylesterase